MKPPIYVAGLPRTGTTWIASVLGATPGTAYFHEPFNYQKVAEAAPYSLRYVRAEDEDPAFAAYCRRCFAGRQRHRFVTSHQPAWRRILPISLGRVLIKDVHSLLALEWFHHHFAPRIVVVLRHPLAVADSWFRVAKGKNQLAYSRLLGQSTLLEDHLQPFAAHLRAVDNFWSRMGAYWAACYHVVLQQQRRHPDWVVVRHEDLLEDPVARFRELGECLGLRWTARAERRLRDSNAGDSHQPFVPRRTLAQEKEKWREHLTAEQAAAVIRAAKPFGVAAYPL